MNESKTCVLVDSGCDVPQPLRQRYDIRVLPLKIIYPEGEYADQVTITAQQVYDRFPGEIPKTSLPDGATIEAALDAIRADGYENVLVVCISSGLSGTCGMVTVVTRQYEGLRSFVLDTRNISIGSGMLAIVAARWLEEGMGWDELVEKLPRQLDKSKVFFCLDTLEYLRKGGRLGLVPAIAGAALHLKPIISCNPDGVYYVVAKMLGRKRALERMLHLAAEYAASTAAPLLALMSGGAEAEEEHMLPQLRSAIAHGELLARGQISPALVVHTGPGLLGICVCKVK